MSISLGNIFHKKKVEQSSVQPAPALPKSEGYIQAPESKESIESIQREEFSETSALADNLSNIYSKLMNLANDFSQALIMHNAINTEFIDRMRVKVADTERLFRSLHEESSKIQELSILIKRKLMHKHELHSEKELLGIQEDAFKMVDDVKIHFHRIEDIMSFVQVTLIEMGVQCNQTVPPALALRESLKEVHAQTKQSAWIVGSLLKNVSTLQKLESDVKEVTLSNTIHKDVSLEKEDIEKLSTVFVHLESLFRTLNDHYNLEKITPQEVTPDLLLPYIECLEHKILPTLQKCMKYENAIFKAATDADLDEAHGSSKRELILAQDQIKLFSANIRGIFTDLNTTLLAKLKDLNQTINNALAKSKQPDSALQAMAVKSSMNTVQLSLDQSKRCILQVQERILYLKKNSLAMLEFMLKTSLLGKENHRA